MATRPSRQDHAGRRTLLTVLRARRPRGDRGAAMVLVLGTALVLSALVVATLAFTVNGVRSSRGDQDWQAALPAAEAGIDHYMSRLNENGSYWRFGNPAAPFSASSPGLVLPTGASANGAFTGWTDVPGAAGRAQFRYAVDTSAFFTTGVIRLQSTGRVGNRTRTVESSIGRRNFIDYLYFTEYEAKDPELYSRAATVGDSYDPDEAKVHCNRRFYERNAAGLVRQDRVNNDLYTTRNPGCININFVSGDVLDGPVHSNDAFYVCKDPKFSSTASTSYDGSLTAGRRYVRNLNTSCGSASAPQIAASGNNFVYAPKLTLPPTNLALANQVKATHTAPDAPGCLYTGPTRIRFNANGTMDVTSPSSANPGAGCGPGTGLTLPTRGVIWVRNVPTANDSQKNSSPAGVAGSSCSATSNLLGYPRAFTISGTSYRDRTPYPCTAGDAIVSGELKGQVTVGTENNIIIADDTRYSSSTCTAAGSACTDVLGLVANNYVEVMHPVWCDSSNNCWNLSPDVQKDLTVEAAILSVQHGFRVQNYQLGASLGTLTVRGAIGQKFRGAVGASSTSGYLKAYHYDWRLRYASPPYFLDPVESSFGQKTWSEPTAAYPATAP